MTLFSNLHSFSSDLVRAPWDLHPAHHRALLDAAQAFDASEFFRLESPPQAASSRFRTPVELSPDGRRAVVNVSGAIYNKVHPVLKEFFGLSDLQDLNHDIGELTDDSQIETVIYNIDSPGGAARPSAVTADLIASQGAAKRTVAYSDNLQASAGYKLAAACQENYAAPAAEIGCIGTYSVLVDDSEYWKEKGVNIDVIRDGKYKAMGHPGKPVTDAERDLVADEVSGLSTKFKDFVRSHRPGIAESAMEGQTLTGQAAIDARLIDGIYNDLGALVASEIKRPLTF